MKFQIYGKDKKCKLVTESKSCIPDILLELLVQNPMLRFPQQNKADLLIPKTQPERNTIFSVISSSST